jgi:hypothetical protein
MLDWKKKKKGKGDNESEKQKRRKKKKERTFTSSSPSILYMTAAGVFIDGSPSGRPTTARKCCSCCEV